MTISYRRYAGIHADRRTDGRRNCSHGSAHRKMEHLFLAQMLRKSPDNPRMATRQPANRAIAVRSRGCELSRCDYIPLVTPPIHTATHPKTKKRPPVCARHTPSVRRQCAAKGERLFRAPLPWPLTPSHRSPADFQPAIRDFDSFFKLPVSPFVVALVPGTTRWHANEAATALPSPRRASARSLLRPLSPTTAFEHLTDQVRHRGPTRRPQWILR